MATINLGAIKFNWKGAYNNSTAYAVDDVVSSSGNSYVCIQASQGNAVGNATAYWNIMSSAGTNGSNGTDLSSLLSTRGDLVFKNASALARLPKGSNGSVLRQGANDPFWGGVNEMQLSAATLTSGTIPNARYGTPTFNGSNITNLPQSGKLLQAKSNVNTSVVSSGQNLGGNDFSAGSPVSVSNGTQVCTITITPISATSHFFCWFSSANGMTSNGKGCSAIFVGSSRINLTNNNGYAGDIDNQNVHGIFNNSNTNQVVVQARNMGTTTGATNYTNSDSGGNYNGGAATLTVIEIED